MDPWEKMFSPSVGICFALLCLSVVLDSGVDADGDTNRNEADIFTDGLTKPLKYHLNTPHAIRKRSTRVNPHNIFAESLASVCAVVNSKIQIKVNDTSLNPTKDDEEKYEQTSNWPMPAVFPVKISVQGKSGKVKFTFDVFHTSKAFAASVGSLDYRETAMNSSKNRSRSTTSKVEFLEDDAKCRLDPPYYYRDPEYLFSLASNTYVIRVSVDLCRFNWEYSRDKKFYIGKDNTWGKSYLFAYRFQSKKLPTPRFRVLSDPGDKIYISKGKNPTIEVEVDFYQAFDFTVRVTLWDWARYKYVSDDVRMDGGESIPESLQSWNNERSQNIENERLLNVELIGITFNNTVVKDVYVEGKERSDVRARIRITVNIGPRRMSGKLVLGYHWRETRWFVRPIVRSISTERTIALKLPYKLSIFPRNEIEVRGGEFDCDERGNRARPRYGKSCTIECHAHGTNIRSITIMKSSPYRPPIKSTSFFTQDAAHAIHNVGPASADNAGMYRCVVISENRMVKSANISLHIAGFTKITNLTAEDLGNSTSRIVCSADGDQPLNMSISISDDKGNFIERIDNKIGNLAYYESSEDNQTTSFILLLCSDQLQVQTLDLIVCEAKGGRGQDSKKLYLPRDNTGNCNSPLPKMKGRESNITNAKRDRILVFCSAFGGGDVDMMVSYGGVGERYRIDKNHDSWFRDVRDTDDGKTISVEIKHKSIKKPWTTLHCGAKNKYGSDWIDFDLEDYGL